MSVQPVEVDIGPNPGPQSDLYASAADITVYGGQAGGGKSYGVLLRMGVHADQVNGYAGIIFRREMPMVTVGGGLWEESMGLLPVFGGRPNSANYTWRFSERSMIQFRSLQHEKDMLAYQGAQLHEFCFDEATHFTESQFWYLYSRLRKRRNEAGEKPFKSRCILTCNPDPDSWVRKLIDWWIGEDGLAIPDRAGKKRYFARVGDDLVWGDSPAEVRERAPAATSVGSLRFIPAKLADNPKGDPDYSAKLAVLPMVERERLLGGNWNVRAIAGSYFRRGYFRFEDGPIEVKRRVRGWDLAATEPTKDSPDPDWTVGVLLAELSDGTYLIEDVVGGQLSPAKVDMLLMQTAAVDGLGVIQAFWQDPAQAGKAQKGYIAKLLRGFRVRFVVASEDKETYAGPVSSDAENGLIKIRRGAWYERFMRVLEGFPVAKKKDDVDALSRAHRELTKPSRDMKSEHIEGF